jgi:putative ABC transport system permease protein
MTTIATDVRHALRRWARAPGFAATAVLTLALGIGATTAIFSVVDAVLLTPLPWRDADRLATVAVTRPHWRNDPTLSASWDRGQISWPIYDALRAGATSLEDIGTYGTARVALGHEPREIVGALRISSRLLPMLGVTPIVGRFFGPDDDDRDTGGVLISEEAWRRRFGGTMDIVGRLIVVDDAPRTVAGVVPQGFNLAGTQTPPEIFQPWGAFGPENRTPGNHFLNTIARLRPGVSLEAALAEVEPLVRGDSPPAEKGAAMRWLADAQLGSSRRPLAIIFGAAALLLLIACSNVAGLFLAQAEARRHELAVRAALGGGRRRLARELLVEGLLIGAAAAVAGVAVAWAATPALVSIAPSQLPRIGNVAIDVRVVTFAAGVSVMTALVFSLVPALSLSSVTPTGALREAGRTPGLRRNPWHRVIVTSQIALAVVLLTGASLLGESLVRLTSVPVGFDAGSVAMLSGQWPSGRLDEPALASRTDEAIAALAAVPGTVAVAGVHVPPFSGLYGSNSIQIEGRRFDRDPSAARQMVTERYFDAMGLPILKGRGFEPGDRPGSHVAVVSIEFERAFFDGDAVGKRFVLNGDPFEIIGVTSDAKQRGYTDPATPMFYGLHRQQPNWTVSTFVVRTSGEPAVLLPRLRDALRAHAPRFAIQTSTTMTELMSQAAAQERYRATLAVAFGAAALGLTLIGLYGLVSRGVSDRRREIGVRMALGAPRGAVLRQVLGQGARLTGAGLLIGVPAALMAARGLDSLLYGVEPDAAHTFVLVTATLLTATLAATFVPARRASRIEPMEAIRE